MEFIELINFNFFTKLFIPLRATSIGEMILCKNQYEPHKVRLKLIYVNIVNLSSTQLEGKFSIFTFCGKHLGSIF